MLDAQDRLARAPAAAVLPAVIGGINIATILAQVLGSLLPLISSCKPPAVVSAAKAPSGAQHLRLQNTLRRGLIRYMGPGHFRQYGPALVQAALETGASASPDYIAALQAHATTNGLI